jgi:hypothetical protein
MANASQDFYSTSLQLLVVLWLIMAVETRALREEVQLAESRGLALSALAALTIAALVVVWICLDALSRGTSYGGLANWFIRITLVLHVVLALLALITVLITPTGEDHERR